MLHKKGETQYLTGIITILVFLVVFGGIYFYFLESDFKKDIRDHTCAISVRMNAKLIEFFGILLPGTPDLACVRRDVGTLKGSEKDVTKKIIKLMGRCWEMFGTIPHAKIMKEGWIFDVNSYNSCYTFNVDVEKSDNVDFGTFLCKLNKPMNEILGGDFRKDSFVDYVDRTGLWGANLKLRIDNDLIKSGFCNKENNKCSGGKIPHTYRIMFYDGFEPSDPDRLILTEDYAFDGSDPGEYLSRTDITRGEVLVC